MASNPPSSCWGGRVSTPAGLELARRASREGHWIGNHTWSHVGRLGEGTREVALQEFEHTEQALSWVQQPVPLFRPRGGAGSSAGVCCIRLWSSDSRSAGIRACCGIRCRGIFGIRTDGWSGL